nr:hypothetical protein [Tanacetum cinerariifolium]
MTLNFNPPSQILNSHGKAIKEENVENENLFGIDKEVKTRPVGTLCIEETKLVTTFWRIKRYIPQRVRKSRDQFLAPLPGSNSCAYNPNSFDCPPDSYHPPHPTYETYSSDTYGNDSHFDYDCPPRFPLNYKPEPGYIQNYNSYPHDSPSFPQQYPCCEDCGVTHEPYQCQPKNYDYYHEQNSCCDSNSIGFDQFQPQQYPCCEDCGVIHEPYQCQPKNHDYYHEQNSCCDSNSIGFDQFQPQQYPCCEDCGVIHEPYQCQPKNHDYYHEQNSCCDSNSIGFDQFQPQQYTVNHPIFNAHKDYLDSQKKFTMTLTTVTKQMISLTSMCELACQIVQKKLEEKQLEEEQAAKAQSWKLLVCYDDDDDEESSNSLEDNIIFELPPCVAITPNEPVDSLSMGDEHLNTIPATEFDEFIKSCVENLVPNRSESEGGSECDMPAGFTTFSNVFFNAEYDFDSSDDQSFSDEDLPKKIHSNPLFDEEIIPMNIDLHSFNTESDLIESMPNHDSLINISSKIDFLFDEFAGKLTLLKTIPLGIDETDCHPEKETRFAKRLLYDNSSPRPPEEIVFDNSNADIESFSPSPIPVEDSDSHMEEIDLPFTPDDPMPPGIEEEDYDSGRDIPIHEELLDNYSLSLLVNESYHFDIPSPYRPPVKPPDGKTGTLNIKMMGDVSDQKVSIHGFTITRILNQEKSPDLVPHRGLEAFQPSAECPMIINGKNTPLLDVPLFHFYPLDQTKYKEN